MKVLVLEDNEGLLELIKEVLEESGYKVTCFVDGINALEHCCDGFDCFILDINVPSLDGLTLLSEIRDRDKETPAIIISANIELETVKKAYISGCNDFLKKPFYMYELETKIKQFCEIKTSIPLANEYQFDMTTESLLDEKGENIKLSKKERRFLVILLKHANRMTPLSTVEDYVWEGEMTTSAGIRSMVKRLRGKIPESIIVSHHFGYEIKTLG